LIILTHAAETWTTIKTDEGRLSSIGKPSAEYLVRYAREVNGGRSTVEKWKSFTMN
jgi:hypothetical protein